MVIAIARAREREGALTNALQPATARAHDTQWLAPTTHSGSSVNNGARGRQCAVQRGSLGFRPRAHSEDNASELLRVRTRERDDGLSRAAMCHTPKKLRRRAASSLSQPNCVSSTAGSCPSAAVVGRSGSLHWLATGVSGTRKVALGKSCGLAEKAPPPSLRHWPRL